MRTLLCSLIFALIPLGSLMAVPSVVFFDEQFDAPVLDPSTWRAEIATSGVRWCDTNPGAWEGPGHWVDEGEPCYGVAAYPPYGSADLSDGMLHLSSTNGQACPYVVSRLPGSVALFPSEGDFTLKVGMRFDHITFWGTYLVVLDTPSTEPIGTNEVGHTQDVLLMIAGDGNDGWLLHSALDGSLHPVANVPFGFMLRDFELECAGTSFTVRVDGEVVYGPINATLRPTAIFMGNPVLAYWYPTDWCWFTVDYIRVEVPVPVAAAECSWTAIKGLYR